MFNKFWFLSDDMDKPCKVVLAFKGWIFNLLLQENNDLLYFIA
jgi:hypothetical protein